MDEVLKSNVVVGPAGFPFFIIPFPSPIPVGFGIDSTTGPHGCFLQARGLKHERELIEKAAHKIGLSRGELMRRVCIDVAKYIIENYPDPE